MPRTPLKIMLDGLRGRGGVRSYTFYAPLINSIALAFGSGAPSFTRASPATHVDFESAQRQVAAGVARFTGARMVANYAGFSEDVSQSEWVKTGTATSTGSTQLNFPAINDQVTNNCFMPLGFATAKTGSVGVTRVTLSGTGTITLGITDNIVGLTEAVVTLFATPTVYSVAITSGGAGRFTGYLVRRAGNTATAVIATKMQMEIVTGQSNQNPGDYVSTGILSAPYHGAGKDGVQFFPYLNGNTVASNVVTEAQGLPIADATLKGYLSELAATNLALWSRDMTNAAWVKTNITPTLTATGVDGEANSASTLTSTAINGTVLQTVALASSTRANSAYIRRRTGIGAIFMTTDGGVTYTDITSQLGASYVLVQITQAAVTNPSFGFKIAVSGDAIDVDMNQNEAGTFATTAIPTTTVAVTRNADVLTYQVAGNMLATAGSCYAEVAHNSPLIPAQVDSIVGTNVTGRLLESPDNTSLRVIDAATNIATIPLLANWSLDTIKKVASSWGTGMSVTSEGQAPAHQATFTSMSTANPIGVGCFGSGSNQIGGSVRNVRIWLTQLSDATLQALTT